MRSMNASNRIFPFSRDRMSVALLVVRLERLQRLEHDRDPLGRGHRRPGGPGRLGGADRGRGVVGRRGGGVADDRPGRAGS